MAKKAVASLQTGSKRLTKAVKMVKSPKSGAYTFVEAIMDPTKVNDFLAKKYIFFIMYQSCFLRKAAFFVSINDVLLKGVISIQNELL